jgi:flagellar basal-body rod protein FlgC
MSSLSRAIDASASALNAQRARMEVAVSNLANAESSHGPDGQPYRRRDIVLSASPIESFDSALGRANAVGVKVAAVLEDTQPSRRRYEPSHPDADKEGFVSMPNVDVPEEMVDMLGAARAYQANLTAISVINETIRKALELGR